MTDDVTEVVAGPAKRAFVLRVAYDGTNFHGWQRQDGLRTVEDVLHRALREMDPNVSAPRGCSRTDAGVHARDQRVAFDAVRHIPARGWVLGTNQHLPPDVVVRAARRVPVGFAPRFATKGKRYEYSIAVDSVRCPFGDAWQWRIAAALDLDRMNRAAETLIGTHDFRAYRTARDERENTMRTVDVCRVEERKNDGGDLAEPRALRFVVEGSAFMHNMVRIIVGSLVDVGAGRLAEEALAEALIHGDRTKLGTTAPAHGLLLARVDLVEPDMSDEQKDAWP